MSEPGANSKFRLLGGVQAGDKVAPPFAARGPAPAPVSIDPPMSPPPPPAPPVVEPIFLANSVEGADLLNLGPVVQPLAHLCVTPQVQTPFLAALAGPSGAGKTFALARLKQAIDGLSGATAGPALGRVATVHVDAAGGTEASIALASAAYAALDREPGGVDYSALLDDLGHAGGDPHRAATAAADRHEDVLRKLEAERVQRDDVEARRARLADSLLFDTPGSRIDAFIRGRRGTIEARLRRFGLAGADADASYRHLVRDMSTLGAGARAAIILRSIWGYGSQARLLLWAIVAFVLAFGLRLIANGSATPVLERQAEATKPVADWIGDHSGWFDRASEILLLLGALALLINLWRALSFSSLLLRGARLLSNEVRERARDLNSRIGRLNQRVMTLTTEAEAAAKRAEAATSRAGHRATARAPGPEFLDMGRRPETVARAFLAALAGRIAQPSALGPAPERLVFLVDNLDALPPAEAVEWIDAAQGALGEGSVAVLAFDPRRLIDTLAGERGARRRLDRWLQLTVNLPARSGGEGEALIGRLLSAPPPAPAAPDGKLAAALVEPLSSVEKTLLAALAPLAAQSPRGAKHFINAYRLARCSTAPRPAVALMQAVAFADDESRAAMRARLASVSGDATEVSGPLALVNAAKAARAAAGGPIPVEDANAAAEVAARYAPPL